MEITLNLPENIYKNVSTVAKKSKRKVVDLIVDVVEEKYSSQLSDRLLANRSDAEVLALANLQIPEKQSHRHSELLYKNQAGTLTPEEKKELDFFQQIYGVALSQKRMALPKPFAAS
ncbi:MAG: hypothetical protein M3R14_14855 [Acidobacteriota bacterium]|nr:hypothetical protein [Acidobacteriota bacterium]